MHCGLKTSRNSVLGYVSVGLLLIVCHSRGFCFQSPLLGLTSSFIRFLAAPRRFHFERSNSLLSSTHRCWDVSNFFLTLLQIVLQLYFFLLQTLYLCLSCLFHFIRMANVCLQSCNLLHQILTPFFILLRFGHKFFLLLCSICQLAP